MLAIGPAAGAAAAATVITGSVEAQPDCAAAPMEAWLAAGSTLLYQVEIPQHGTFEFHVNSGPYTLTVVGASGCLAEQPVEARENDTTRVTLRPAPQPAPRGDAAWWDGLFASAFAAGLDDCAVCGRAGGLLTPPSISVLAQADSPWWVSYASVSYANFDRPAPWRDGGVDGTLLPGEGGVFALRPVAYLSGTPGTQVSVRVRLAGATHWLAAVPAHGDAGWSGRLGEDRIESAGARYRHLFYDYRAAESSFQDMHGFCTKRGELIPELTRALRRSGFRNSEAEDFAAYWKFKMPPSDWYCVYPQTTRELAAIAPLEITPPPSSLTQLLFVVQPGERLDGKGKFRHAPVATWRPEAGPRAPAAAAPFEVREWGVAFLQGGELRETIGR